MASWSLQYQASTNTLWQGRPDALPGERLFQRIQTLDLSKTDKATRAPAFAFLGFCSDIGVRRNLGRPGAANGPTHLRKALGNLPIHRQDITAIYDAGDIIPQEDDLESAQAALGEAVNHLLSNNITPILLGGGHEIAWGHFQGLRQAKPKARIGIINFDAHYDMRPLSPEGLGSSGTPFLQIAQAEQEAFHYCCVGVQKTANTLSLFETAKAYHVDSIFAEQCQAEQLDALAHQLLEFCQAHDWIYLTVCLDVFSAAIAPGVSAPQALGLFPWQVIPLLRQVLQSGKVLSMDLAEYAPDYDRDAMTASLAASLVSDMFHYHRLKE